MVSCDILCFRNDTHTLELSVCMHPRTPFSLDNSICSSIASRRNFSGQWKRKGILIILLSGNLHESQANDSCTGEHTVIRWSATRDSQLRRKKIAFAIKRRAQNGPRSTPAASQVWRQCEDTIMVYSHPDLLANDKNNKKKHTLVGC